jgi:hypothetical protein
MHIIGPHGFILNSTAEFLAPTQVDNHLAITTLNGDVTFYAP